jgi:regulator of sigma E protease
VGITCPAFSVGFPLPVWTRRGWIGLNIFRYRWRGTEYRLGWIPFGGYVTMQGQSDSPNKLEGAREGDQSDYRNKSYWEKTQVLLAGVAMNAVTAVIGFVIAFQIGVTFIEPTVGMVTQNSQAWMDNEIQVGDRILEANGREVVDFEDVVYAGIFDGGDTIDVLLERDTQEGPLRKRVTLGLDKHPLLGIKTPAISALRRVIITGPEAENFPAELGDDRPRDGDEIVAVNGVRVRNELETLQLIDRSRGPLELTLQRGFNQDARTWQVRYTPRRTFWSDNTPWSLGMSVLPTPVVDQVRRGGPASAAGLRSGDVLSGVVRADGEIVPIRSMGDLSSLVDASAGMPMALRVIRDGQDLRVEIHPEPRELLPERYQLGFTIKYAEDFDRSTVVAYGVREGGIAHAAGIEAGSHIVGVKVRNREVLRPGARQFDVDSFYYALRQAMDDDAPAPITLAIEGPDGVREVTLQPQNDGPESGAYMELAVAERRSEPVTYGLLESVSMGFYHSKKVGYKIIMTLSGLFTGRVKIWHLGGPVVIAKRSYTLAQWGAGTLIFFLAFISINLAIINLLPLPVLDGGQWLIVTIEAIRGKPLPEKSMNWVSLTSFVAVLGLMAFILANDLVTVFVRKWV